MSRIVNGTLTVPQFTPTENVGEYYISGGIFTNQSDVTGNGAYDIQPNFVIYVPATNTNSFELMLGTVHRYKVTAVTVIDQVTVDLTVVWDEEGPETDSPTNGMDCLITQVSQNRKFGYIVDSTLYPSMPSYVVPSALNTDIDNIDDLAASYIGGGAPSYLHKQLTENSVWVVQHNQNSVDFMYTIFDSMGQQVLPNTVTTLDSNTFEIHYLSPMTGKVICMFVR